MNYIKQLQNKVAELEKEKSDNREVIVNLHRYLMSDKFHCGDELDGYVNISDVTRMTAELL